MMFKKIRSTVTLYILLMMLLGLASCTTPTLMIHDNDSLIDDPQIVLRDLTRKPPSIAKSEETRGLNQEDTSRILTHIQFVNDSLTIMGKHDFILLTKKVLSDPRNKVILVGYSYGPTHLKNSELAYQRTDRIAEAFIKSGLPSSKIIRFATWSSNKGNLSKSVTVYLTSKNVVEVELI